MTFLIKLLSSLAALIISLDVILMMINGTMLTVLITLICFYSIISLAFKETAWLSIKRWIITGHFLKKTRRKNYDKLTR